MKKKIWILILCLGLVLFTPIPTGVYKDGGTKEFTALTYKIVKYNHLTDGGIYKKLKIYPFPMNFFSIDSLLAREEKNFPKSSSSQISTSSEVASSDNISSEIDTSSYEYKPLIEYEPQFIRTNGYIEGASYPRTKLIENVSELNEYYEKHKDIYDLKKFKEATEIYDESFFKSHKLVMVVLEEGSGSIRHKVNAVKSGGGDRLQINIERVVPEAMTADMAQWHILIDTDASISNEGDIKLTLSQKNVNTSKKTVTIKYENGKIGSKKINTFSGEKANQLTYILNNLSYDRGLCKCYPEYTVTTENGTYGVKIDSEGYARFGGKQANLSGENYKKVKELLIWALENASTESITSVKEKP